MTLAACSTIKLGYNNLDEVAYWWLDSYIDFRHEQSSRVREDLARLHQWHRAEELPRLAALLHDLEKILPHEVSAGQACSFVDRVRQRATAVAGRAEPAVVALAVDLQPVQLAHLERKYEKNNATWRKDWVQLTQAELQEKRFKQFLERSEMVYGRLEEPQRMMLRRRLTQSIFDPSRLLAARQHRQQDAMRTLRKVAGQPLLLTEARSLLRDLLERSQLSSDPSHRDYQRALIEEGCHTFADLHNSTTPAQREAAVQRLRAWQRDLGDLAAPQ